MPTGYVLRYTKSMMKHSEWLTATTHNDSLRAVGRNADIPFRTITGQTEREAISAENIIKIAVAYGHNPVTALVDTGYLDEHWATAADPIVALRTVTEEQLAEEILRRMKVGVETDSFTTPIDELAARRESARSDTHDGTVTDWDGSKPAAADSSPDENEERIKRGEDPID